MADQFDYWLSFEIKDEIGRDGRTYGQRYVALTGAVKLIAPKRWEENTSFYLLRSPLSIADICAKLRPAIDETKDRVLIRYLAQGEARLIGVYQDGTLNEFLPYLKKG